MRCCSCNRNLNDFESTRKDTHGNYLDLCNRCFRDIEDVVPVIERDDLAPNEESIEDDDFGDEILDDLTGDSDE